MRALLFLLFVLLGTLSLERSATAAQQPSDFRQRYEQARKINAVEEMGRLIRQNETEAIHWIMETCEAIAIRSSEELEDRIEGLKIGWKQAIGSDFVDRMYTYFSLLSPPLRRERDAARERYAQVREQFIENQGKKHRPTFGLLAIEFRGLARVFEEVGDRYHASQSWQAYAVCIDEVSLGKEADLYEVAHAYKKALDARKEVGLEDFVYREALQRYNFLVAQGYGERPSAEAKGGSGAGFADDGLAAVAELQFALVPKLDAIARPSYNLDELYQMWDSVYFTTRGSTATIGKLEGLSPRLTRRGEAQIVVEAEGSEKEIEVPLTGNFEPVRFEIGTGEERRPWAMLTKIGIQDDRYQGIQINLAPSTEQLNLYYVNAGSMVGQVGGVRVQVLDDNLDGKYGSPPRGWQNIGLSAGVVQPELDSIVVGNEKRARPWSELQKIGESWYRLEPQLGGRSLSYTPVQLATGFLSLDFTGPAPSWVVVQGTGPLENCFFDLTGARGKGTEVPIGTYALYYGEVRSGRRAQMMKTLILPGESTPRWEVTEGEARKVSLGGPFDFDFKHQISDGALVVRGQSVVVVGRAGERYERPWNCVPSPDVSWREKGSRRASRGESMSTLMDSDTVFRDGFGVAWFPHDLRLSLPPNRTELEVQLSERRHKLFGKIETPWRE